MNTSLQKKKNFDLRNLNILFQNVIIHFNIDRSEGIQHMSESGFRRLCLEFGTSQQVAIRRDRTEIEEIVLIQVISLSYELYKMISGSYKQGFRFFGSDIEFMTWKSIYRVVTDIFQSVY